jgi:hypothetical protein
MALGKFPDIAPQLGLDTFDLCGGAIMDDFDNDGRLDIVTSTYDPNGPLHYFRSLGNGEFEDVSRTARLTEQLRGLNCLGADSDNDGRRDVLVLRGAWLHDDGQTWTTTGPWTSTWARASPTIGRSSPT